MWDNPPISVRGEKRERERERERVTVILECCTGVEAVSCGGSL